MVSATHGVLFTGDVALIEFIRALNDKQPVADKFIIEGALGDQHLLIREQRAQWSSDQQQQRAPAGSVLELLDGVAEVQRQRAAAYRRFDSAFKAYLHNQAEGPYRFQAGQLTAEFQQLSALVIGAEAALRGQGQADLADLLRTVQENEREKLRLTVALQALKAAHAQQRFSWQHEEAASSSLAPGVSDLLQGHLCGLGCMHEAPADEPTKAEYAAAVKETYQLLQASITAINEALEEVRQVAADLLEQ
ncbi:hypothetical protein C2E20_3660 [Micractinium conductrix]|uniref:Uncharacterized protein n=1 Tax=Micractinium conductrix TaxID=554055 RepID=A0A2P6VFW1_9CHLO|nr:hypothetical protein C2E20_3660 [Micractinium conductrix]|eukprot:PSC72968.1 hypothetical protein C2E20_3660 [Micractinium conductrix]